MIRFHSATRSPSKPLTPAAKRLPSWDWFTLVLAVAIHGGIAIIATPTYRPGHVCFWGATAVFAVLAVAECRLFDATGLIALGVAWFASDGPLMATIALGAAGFWLLDQEQPSKIVLKSWSWAAWRSSIASFFHQRPTRRLRP